MEALLRELAPQILAALARSHPDFDRCEDAVQEALIAAARQWPANGVPVNPRGWLITVASRRRIELWRGDEARRRREDAASREDVGTVDVGTSRDTDAASGGDDSLLLLLLCCHPALTPASQVALTLRAVGGLTTAEIARAFLVPEATVAQRISRAKQRIRESGLAFAMPQPMELRERVEAVLHVLYLVFNEGYTASSGDRLVRADLSGEAIRLARQLHAALPGDGEVSGLLALMLLSDARRPARVGPDGALVPLTEQDRSRWERQSIEEGIALIESALATATPGPYQLQAAIAAVHAEAARAEDTDWRQILALYDLLEHLAPGPIVTLNRIVAVAMVHGPLVAFERLEAVAGDPALAGHHRVDAVRAHLLEMAGQLPEAATAYELAAQRTVSLPERRYLERRARRLRDAT